MEEKTRPELITGGPYAYVRHPIYAGFILAILGSAIGQSISWVIALLIVGPYFVYCALREEKQMVELFPRQYSAYMTRTKMLIPFIL
jgi:protein-S-isoprenylcysteine O-methyltransferase Ste14